METRCASCLKPVRFEPAKCPYCTVVQPKRAYDPVRHRRQTIALAALGLLAGFGGALPSAVRAVREDLAARLEGPQRKLEAEEDRIRLRARFSEELLRLERAGTPIVDLKDLSVSPRTYLGRRIALVGYTTFMELREDQSRVCLASEWAGGRLLEVDVSGLAPAVRAALLRAPMRPSLAIVEGQWIEMPAVFAGLNSASGSGLKADSVAFLGPTPNAAGSSAQELLGAQAPAK